MIKTISKATFAVVLGLGLVTAQAEEQHAIIVKTGSFSLDETTQDIIQPGLSTFTEGSDSELSIEYERNMGNNLTFGGEIVMYSNKYTDSGIAGEADGMLIMFNARKYFDVANITSRPLSVAVLVLLQWI